MFSHNRGVRTAIILLALAQFVTVACGGTKDNAPPPESTPALPPADFTNYPPQANDFRYHWSAAPGIALETGPAVVVRAYLESMRLAAFAGGDSSVTYPGFMRATPENIEPGTSEDAPFQVRSIRPKTRAQYEANGLRYIDRQVFGYQPTHILDLAPLGNGYRATICLGAYSVYRSDDADHSKYFSTAADETTGQMLRDDSDIQFWRVELSEEDPRVVNPLAPQGTPQAGPLPAPLNDVFGRWFITGSSQGLWGRPGRGENIDTPELRQQCEAAMPDDAANRRAMATGFHDAPPPHGDPIPGWPAASG
ncbi:hypothetical protein MARA_55280 [Mycolicibacterium arabiense]|uniref:Lipoprotein n=1 Tax=Mycolicibacterium arabiense TaxID=1286181 RepID=A0A7I7S6F4_9MYCO|nr:hypothetical protein MARA_55280 [Mycolicibacterium arabiense]